MPTLDQYRDYKPGMFALFKGDSGAGKTVAALSFPNVYSFDFDRKLPGVALKHFRDRSDIAWDHYNDIFATAEMLDKFIKDGCPYETLVFDSVTHLSTMCLNAVGTAKGERVVEMLQRASTNKKGNSSIELMGIDYYNGETNFLVRYFLDAIKVLHSMQGNPKHVILIAHVVTTESAPDLKTKLVTRSSSIVTAGRKCAAVVPTVFDDAYHFCLRHDEKDNTPSAPMRRIVLTQATGEEFSKCSYNLPREIDFTNGSFYGILTDKYLSF